MKELISYCAMNIFTGFLCSTKFEYSDRDFQTMTRKFDFIFEDINNGHPTDFLPWLSPLFGKYLTNLKTVGADIRKIILERIINEKYATLTKDPENVNDLSDAYFSNLLVSLPHYSSLC